MTQNGAPGRLTQRQRAFLVAYPRCWTISAACGAAGVSRETHYRWLRESEGYEAAFHNAREEAADRLEGLALERAMNPDLPGSTTMLTMLLRAARPEKYGGRRSGRSAGEAADLPRVILVDEVSRDRDQPVLARSGGVE